MKREEPAGRFVMLVFSGRSRGGHVSGLINLDADGDVPFIDLWQI